MILQIADTDGHEFLSVRPHGHLPPAASRPLINAAGGLSYEEWRLPSFPNFDPFIATLIRRESNTIMRDENVIVRDLQLVIRRELDRRGISLKAIAFDARMSYSTLLSYFPGERDKTPATISGAAIYALCDAVPAELLSLLLPDGFQIVRAPEQIDHDELADLASDYMATKNAAHHPDSENGRDIGPNENVALIGKAVSLGRAA